MINNNKNDDSVITSETTYNKEAQRNPIRRMLFAFYLIIASAYVVWRPIFTFNRESLVYSLVFYLAELVCIVASVIFYIIILVRI